MVFLVVRLVSLDFAQREVYKEERIRRRTLKNKENFESVSTEEIRELMKRMKRSRPGGIHYRGLTRLMVHLRDRENRPALAASETYESFAIVSAFQNWARRNGEPYRLTWNEVNTTPFCRRHFYLVRKVRKVA